jgi:hypothetical protein
VSSAATEIVMDGVSMANAGGSLSVGAGQTQQWNRLDGGGWGHGAGSTEVGSATTTMSWSYTASAGWAQVAWAVKQTSGGGGGATTRFRTLMGVGQ